MNWVSIGYLATSHGVHGNAKVKQAGDSWNQIRFPREMRLFKNKQSIDILVTQADSKPDCILIQVDGINNPEFWDDWKGGELQIPKEELESLDMDEDSYFHFQLIDLRALDENGQDTGYKVSQVEESPAHTNLILTHQGKKIIIPFVKEWVGEVDLKESTILVYGWENWLAL